MMGCTGWRLAAATIVLLILSVIRQSASNENSHATASETWRARCRGTKAGWCGGYYEQQGVPFKEAATHSKPCPDNCSNVGVCNAMLGMCDCPAGWTGLNCSEPLKRPCTNVFGAYHGSKGMKPSSHIDPVTKRDLNLNDTGWTASRCAGICDDDTAACFCDGEKYGRIPAPPGSPPSTPPLRWGRPLPEHCKPGTGPQGQKIEWGRKDIPWDNLYGPQGWCNADKQSEAKMNCGCSYDGWGGDLCSVPNEMFCPNQCSGHGECDRGFCRCAGGWFGLDCAQRMEGQEAEEPAAHEERLQAKPWLRNTVLPPAGSVKLKEGATRKRPLIYVYDVPALFATRMLQYRVQKNACVWRSFGEVHNATELNAPWLYAIETGLHEMLLQSEHRTLDPEEADFFYVPQYSSCFMWPIQGWADYPWWHSNGARRVKHMTVMTLDLKRHIQQAYPYWNRTQGRDHVWLFSHDEGACWAPDEIANTSIILTHWGRMDFPHMSNTAYEADNYTMDWTSENEVGDLAQGWTHLINGHPCYKEGKDLVVPAFKMPFSYRSSPLLGAPLHQRNTLLYFRGDMGDHRMPWYSRGVRQRLYNLSRTHDWKTKYNITIGNRGDVPGDYSRGLATSKFCLVAAGDGFSARAEDAILHGCLPVVIMDNVHSLFESIIDWDHFSVRINQANMDHLPHILMSIPEDRVHRMQLKLWRVMHRFAYFQHPLLRAEAEKVLAEHPKRPPAAESAATGDARAREDQQQQENGAPAGASGSSSVSGSSSSSSSEPHHGRHHDPHRYALTPEGMQDDAFNTILQWLHSKMRDRGGEGATAAGQQLPAQQAA